MTYWGGKPGVHPLAVVTSTCNTATSDTSGIQSQHNMHVAGMCVIWKYCQEDVEQA